MQHDQCSHQQQSINISPSQIKCRKATCNNSARGTVNKGDTTRGKPIYLPHTTLKNKGNQHQCERHVTHHVHQPNRTDPGHIQPGQLVYHGHVQNRWEPNPCGAHEKQNIRGNVQSIQTTHAMTQKLWHNNKETHPQ